MISLRDRLIWTLSYHKHERSDSEIIDALLKEIQATHRIVDPEYVDDQMLEACFNALPEHYDPPDPKRKAWHGYKAKRRYSAMVRASQLIG